MFEFITKHFRSSKTETKPAKDPVIGWHFVIPYGKGRRICKLHDEWKKDKESTEKKYLLGNEIMYHIKKFELDNDARLTIFLDMIRVHSTGVVVFACLGKVNREDIDKWADWPKKKLEITTIPELKEENP